MKKPYKPLHKESRRMFAAEGTDTVPAMLTPKEAVLTPSASELAGRDQIDRLNKVGQPYDEIDRQMGLPPASTVQALGSGVRAYQGGTSGASDDRKELQNLLNEIDNSGQPTPTPTPTPRKVSEGFDPEALVGRPGYVPDSARLLGGGMSAGPAGLSPAMLAALLKILTASGGGTRVPVGKPETFAYGSPDIPAPQMGGGIGYVPPQDVDPAWQQIQLSSPQLNVAALQAAAKKNGVSGSTVADILKVVQGVRGGGMAGNYARAGSPTPVFGESGYPSAIPVGGYQEGISDIGYPPFIGPNMRYSAGRGGEWDGEYDESGAQSRKYAFGSSDVPDFTHPPQEIYYDNLTQYNSPSFQAYPSTPEEMGVAIFRSRFARGTSSVPKPKYFRGGAGEVFGERGNKWGANGVDLPESNIDPGLYPNDPNPSATVPPANDFGGGPAGDRWQWGGDQFLPGQNLDFGERFSQASGGWGGYGNSPSTGLAAFGNTYVPTSWTNYPGVGLVPNAIPFMGPDYVNSQLAGLPQKKQA